MIFKKTAKKKAVKKAGPDVEAVEAPAVEAVEAPAVEAVEAVEAPSSPQKIAKLKELNPDKLKELVVHHPLLSKGANPAPELSVKIYVLDSDSVVIKGASQEQVDAAFKVLASE